MNRLFLLSAFCISSLAGSLAAEINLVLNNESIAAFPGTDCHVQVNAYPSSGEGLEYSYQWYHEDVALVGATENGLYILDISAEETGEYWVSVSNGSETVESLRIPVTLIDETLNEILDNDDIVFETLADSSTINPAFDGDFGPYVLEGPEYVNGSAFKLYYFSQLYGMGNTNKLKFTVEGPVRIVFNNYLLDNAHWLAQVTNTETQDVEHDLVSMYGFVGETDDDTWGALSIVEAGTFEVVLSATSSHSAGGTILEAVVVDNFSLEYAPVFLAERNGDFITEGIIGGSHKWTARADSIGSASYELYREGELVAGSNDGVFVWDALKVEDEGDYRIRVIDEYGENWTEVIPLSVTKTFDLALDFKVIDFSELGEANQPWTVQTEGSLDGIDALVSNTLLDGESLTLEGELVEADYYFSLWWKVSGGGQLSWYLNDVLMMTYEGGGDWEFRETVIEGGLDRNFQVKFTGPGTAYLDRFNSLALNDSTMWLYDRYGKSGTSPLYLQDDDYDGVSNIVEWLLQTDPDQFDRLIIRPIITEENGLNYLCINTDGVRHYSDGWNLVLQGSSDMVEWTDIVSYQEMDLIDGNNETNFIDNVPFEVEGARFLRLVPRHWTYSPGP